ncbi:MAG: hypothetical protein H0X36_14715 [Sphingomonadaceae bacterium]|nr:hypothetical protein [Sphingomonadaceae bacterium]
MATILLRIAQSDPLADLREVVTGAAVAQPFAIAPDEERHRGCPEQAITLFAIVV